VRRAAVQWRRWRVPDKPFQRPTEIFVRRQGASEGPATPDHQQSNARRPLCVLPQRVAQRYAMLQSAGNSTAEARSQNAARQRVAMPRMIRQPAKQKTPALPRFAGDYLPPAGNVTRRAIRPNQTEPFRHVRADKSSEEPIEMPSTETIRSTSVRHQATNREYETGIITNGTNATRPHFTRTANPSRIR